MRGWGRRGLVMLTLWLLCACAPQATEAPEATVTVEPMRLDYNFGAEPLVLDPALIANRTSIEVAAQLFEGLTVFDPESVEPVPALALAWDVSEDGLTYTFRMRDSAQWVTQSGEPQGAVTAEDVAFAIKRVCSPETQTPFKHALFIIKGCQEVSVTEGVPDLDSVGVRALERFTVEFVLEEPASYLPAILALPIARPVPQQAVQQEGQGWTEPSKLLTNGPFLLGAWIPNVSLRLDKNPAYYDAASVGIVRVNGVLRPDSEALALYQSGRLDMARVPPDQMAQLQADPALAAQRLSLPTGCAISYGFTVVKPPVDHARVRRALSLAIDRGRLVADVLQGSATATSRFAPPTVFGAPTSLANVEEDAVQAQSSLAAAGYPGGQGFPSLTLMHPEGEEHARVAAAVADMWRATLRIEVGVVAQPLATYTEIIRNTTPLGEMPHVWLLGWCGEYPDEQSWIYEVFALESGSASGLASSLAEGTMTVQPFGNPVRRAPGLLDELLADAAREPDPTVRQTLYAEAEQLLVEEEALIAPLYHPAINLLRQPWLTHAPYHILGPSIKAWTLDMTQKGNLATPSPVP